jgi:hypothetical protein
VIAASRHRRPPRIYRLGRLFRRLRWVAAIALAVYVATAAYSASELRPSSAGETTASGPGSQLTVEGYVNLSNPGWYPVNAIVLESRVALPNGTSIAHASSPTVGVAPGSHATIAVSLPVNLSHPGPIATLLTNDVSLLGETWANATYAGLFDVSVRSNWTYSWGAPFANLAVMPGSPVLANRTVVVPVRTTFENHAPFDDRGTIVFSVLTAQGSSCASGSFSVDVPRGGTFDQTVNATAPVGCDPSGGSLTAVYSGPGISLELPTEKIP